MIAASHAAVCSSLSTISKQLLQLKTGALESFKILYSCSGERCVDLFTGWLAVINKTDQIQFSPLVPGMARRYHQQI